MKVTKLELLVVLLTSGIAQGVNIQLVSSPAEIPLPLQNGYFSNISSEGYPVEHAYYIISEDDYTAYTNTASPSEAIFEDYLDANKDFGEECIYDEIVTDGYTDIYLGNIFYYYDEQKKINVNYDKYFGYGTNACFVAIYVYSNETSGVTYYIAEPLCISTPTEYEAMVNPFDIPVISDIAINAGRWQLLHNEPPSITCTDLCVTGGVVSATYSISEFSRLNEIVSGEETSVIVAADLARTTQTNLAASVAATNSVDSTFTFSFNPAEQNWTNSTLFIFGVEPPR